MNTFLKKFKNDYKIIFVIDRLLVGGSENQLLLLVSELKKKGLNCIVYALKADGRLLSKFISKKITIIDGGFSEKRNRIKLIYNFFKMLIFFLKNKKSIIHSYMPLSNFFSSIIGKLVGIKIIFTSRRGMANHQDKNFIWKYFDSISNFLSTKIIVNSKAVMLDVISRNRVNKDKISIIYNGIDFKKFYVKKKRIQDLRKKFKLDNNCFAWVKVASLVDFKGHLIVLRAFAKISKYNNTKLFLVGRDRGFKKTIVREIKKLELKKKVIMINNIKNIPEFLLAMNGFVFASFSESSPNAILEALIAKLPIVSTNVGGVSELLENKKFGILIDQGNVKQLAKKMNFIMSNKHTFRKKIKNHFGFLEKKFNSNIMADNFLKLYKKEFKKICVE